jgi:hypothetical protein
MGWIELCQTDIATLYTGDDPWDIMGEAVEKLKAVYLRDIGRLPYLEEIKDTLRFVIGDDIERAGTPYVQLELPLGEKL